MWSLPSLCMSPSSLSSQTGSKEGSCAVQIGSLSGSVAIFGSTTLLDFIFLERFNITTVESSLNRELFPVEDNPPVGVPLIVQRLLGLTFPSQRRCNKFSGGHNKNPHCYLHRYQRLHRDDDPWSWPALSDKIVLSDHVECFDRSKCSAAWGNHDPSAHSAVQSSKWCCPRHAMQCWL